jgi:hypothetical protein
MPGFDGTGPQGRGPLTGRGRGYCILRQANDRPGQVSGLAGIQGTPTRGFFRAGLFRVARRGFGHGFGRGRGRGRFGY